MDSAPLVPPPSTYREGERAFWERAEALAQQFAAGLPQPLAEEARFALRCFCTWPPVCTITQAWAGWDWRFDAGMLALLDGRDLVFIGLDGVEEGWDPDLIIDTVRDFVRWLGALGELGPSAGDHAERVCAEIESARESWLLSIADVRDDPWARVAGEGGCPCCAADQAVAPFVAWLLDTTTFSFERRLLGQALAINALEQLALTSLVDGPFYRLDMRACLDVTCGQTELSEPDRNELCAVARAFATFLAHRCGLSGTHKRRLQNDAERWAATPVRAGSELRRSAQR